MKMKGQKWSHFKSIKTKMNILKLQKPKSTKAKSIGTKVVL